MKWEYKSLQVDRENLEMHLNQLGHEGWEMGNVDFNFLTCDAYGVLKRRLPE